MSKPYVRVKKATKNVSNHTARAAACDRRNEANALVGAPFSKAEWEAQRSIEEALSREHITKLRREHEEHERKVRAFEKSLRKI